MNHPEYQEDRRRTVRLLEHQHTRLMDLAQLLAEKGDREAVRAVRLAAVALAEALEQIEGLK